MVGHVVDGRTLLDLRSVPPACDDDLAAAVLAVPRLAVPGRGA